MANNHTRAIEILEEVSRVNPACSDVDFRKLVFVIAQKHPKAVVDAYLSIKLTGYGPGSWAAQAIPHIRNGKKLEAIKMCKQMTGLTLAEAKTAVEKLMEQLQ